MTILLRTYSCVLVFEDDVIDRETVLRTLQRWTDLFAPLDVVVAIDHVTTVVYKDVCSTVYTKPSIRVHGTITENGLEDTNIKLLFRWLDQLKGITVIMCM
jgi:hypothetical protein